MISNIADLKRRHAALLRTLQHEIDATLDRVGEFAADHVRQHSRFHRRSAVGSLKDATDHRIIRRRGGRILRVRSTKRTARFLEFGTRAHGPVRARFLRFVGRDGRVVFTKWVRGIKPRRFLWRASRAAYRVAGPNLEAAMRRAAKHFD